MSKRNIRIKIIFIFTLGVGALMLVMAIILYLNSRTSVYGTKSERAEIAENIRNSSKLKEKDGILDEDSIMPMWGFSLAQWAKCGEVYFYHCYIDPDVYDEAVFEEGVYDEISSLITEGCIARWILDENDENTDKKFVTRILESTNGGEYYEKFYSYLSFNYTEHAEHIRILLNRKTVVPESDVRLVRDLQLGFFFCIYSEGEYWLYPLAVLKSFDKEKQILCLNEEAKALGEKLYSDFEQILSRNAEYNAEHPDNPVRRVTYEWDPCKFRITFKDENIPFILD